MLSVYTRHIMMSTYQRAISVVGAAAVPASSPTPEATLDCSSLMSTRLGLLPGRLTRRHPAVLKNEVGGLFRQHNGRRVGITGSHVRNGARIDDAQATR